MYLSRPVCLSVFHSVSLSVRPSVRLPVCLSGIISSLRAEAFMKFSTLCGRSWSSRETAVSLSFNIYEATQNDTKTFRHKLQ